MQNTARLQLLKTLYAQHTKKQCAAAKRVTKVFNTQAHVAAQQENASFVQSITTQNVRQIAQQQQVQLFFTYAAY